MHKLGLKLLLLFLLGIVVMVGLHEGENTSSKVEIESKQVEVDKPKKDMMVNVIHEGIDKEIELEEYLEGVVASEMPYTFDKEALKAQCVASRTYVLQRGLKVDDSTSSQVYRSKEQLMEIHDQNYEEMQRIVKEALEETKGQVMVYDGNYISAMFYSSSNGTTNDASWYYANEVPYLKSVDSHWDQNFDHTNAVVEKSISECIQALGITDFTIGDTTFYENGYIRSIVIGGKSFSGREVREKLGLRSSSFSFEVKGDYVFIYTSGFGHGVGMSQYGALGMAQEGYTYDEILKHYYSGVSIVNLNDGV